MRKSWPKVRLGEVLIERREVPDAEALALGNIRIVSKIGFDLGKIELRQEIGTKTGMILIRPGDLVVSGIIAAKGAIAIYGSENTEPIAATIHYGTYSVVRDRADIEYMWWYLRSRPFREILFQSLSEGIKTELKAKRLLPIEIPLSPLSEQRRIVARIEALAAQICEAKNLRQQAIEEAEGLERAEMGKIFAQLSDTHESRQFGEFAPHVTSGPRNWAKHYGETEFRFYRAQDIGPTGVILDNAKVFVAPPFGAQGQSARLRVGDLMIVITGATVGRVGLYRSNLEPGFVSQHVAICRLPPAEIDPEFALWGLRGPAGQAQLLGQRYGQGKPGLNLSNIRSLTLAIPSLSDQRRIVTELDGLQAQVDALKKLQAETAAELNALLPSILDRAFKGEL